MDKLIKQQILLTINQMRLPDLQNLISSGDISLAEMIASGLQPAMVSQIEEQIKADQKNKISDSEIIATCKQVENGEMNVERIKQFLLEGKLTEELLLKHTSLSADMISKIKHYQKQATPFLSWADLPPLQDRHTDLYFFGQPGSGKSCILASLFYYLDQEGMIIENVHNPQGVRYRNQLTNEISYGILPDSTAVEGVNYIPIELINPEVKGNRHPLNFIEMSGELFNRAYEEGISSDNLAARSYLNNQNRKLVYFVLDYDQHEKSRTASSGPLQASKMQAILALLDQFGTLNQVDGIYIVVSKSDLFPTGVDKYQFAKEFLDRNYKNFIANCKNMQEKYKHKNFFKIIVYPYSIGEVKFQNMLTHFDTRSPKELVDDILVQSFVTKKTFLGKLFS